MVSFVTLPILYYPIQSPIKVKLPNLIGNGIKFL
nr:MAG TPA: hypothetical protein [Caudoviricetes sp.]